MQKDSLFQIASSYNEHGYYFPYTLFHENEIEAYNKTFENLEKDIVDYKLGNKNQLNYPHVIFRFANEIVRNSELLDVVESIIGPNIMVWGATFFLKEPQTKDFVSWHQDLRYWGLDNDRVVSAWLALSEVNKTNGCMQFLPGSHKNGLVEHRDSFEVQNILTRGQEAEIGINIDEIVNVEMQAGQVSFHHGNLLHASAANNSTSRRIGFAINYIATDVCQVVAKKDFAMLVRGVDDYGHFEQVPAPQQDVSKQALKFHRRILEAQNEAMYDGTI